MFLPIAADIVGRLVSGGLVCNGASALELGAQTYSIDKETILDIQKKMRAAGKPEVADRLKSFLSVVPAQRPRDPAVPHMRDFFKALGFSSYDAVDISNYGDTRIMDLNQDIREKYNFKETFDLVTNIGVSEHLFNQETFFKNAHAVTKVGGYMLHILPSVSYVNHGFFNYQPIFFRDLASANGYTLEALFLSDRQTKALDLLVPSDVGMHFFFASHALPKDKHGNLLIVALLKKVKDREFVTPLQGKYVGDITDASDKDRYGFIPESAPLPPVPTKGYFVSPTTTRAYSYVLSARRMMYEMLRRLQRFVVSGKF